MKVTMISLPLNPHHICEFLMETRVSLEAVKDAQGEAPKPK